MKCFIVQFEKKNCLKRLFSIKKNEEKKLKINSLNLIKFKKKIEFLVNNNNLIRFKLKATTLKLNFFKISIILTQ